MRLLELFEHDAIFGMGSTTRASMTRLMHGASWQEAGSGFARPSNGSAMRAGKE